MTTKCIVINDHKIGGLQNKINSWLEQGHDFKRSSFQAMMNGNDPLFVMIFFYEEGK
jgi:hypothetical protein